MTRFAGRTGRIVGRVGEAIVCRPYRGLGGLLGNVPHGLRRGLDSVAPPGLLGIDRRPCGTVRDGNGALCRPCRGLGECAGTVPHGLRRGLESSAPPGLFLSWRREVIVDRVPGLWQRM